ncbi:CHAP domain-containing protein [Tengunoibacter tsumagoiensis]|uniref:Peptidase C51 domain-containing protein n=1 Tax=Tengunoibacter tsumagoiensis TaxID=2014871 RepID=A0A401ZX40_9CHLR|nr:CHAP domain-containing protein [Tengunoibacter tsumagoiensis]GCE11410.1 hypothetical protein KTT_12690 [Tengunoibacter tsumagoiensis]
MSSTIQEEELHPQDQPSVETVLLPVVPQSVEPLSEQVGVNKLRKPVRIRGRGKKSSFPLRPPKPVGPRLWLNVGICCTVAVTSLGVLLSVLPVGEGGHPLLFPLFSGRIQSVQARTNNLSQISSQQATATVVMQDGYDAGPGSYAGVPTVVLTNNDGNHFYGGQCTAWASWRYHDATGVWVSWLGNAGDWAAGASAAHWTVSSQPNPNGLSIIVLQPGVQGAGGVGHVAVVERINADGSVYTSNWNWQNNWGITTYWTFKPGPGVSFIWK